MRTLLLISTCCLMMSSFPVSGGDRVTGQPFATRSEVIARHGMAATSQPLVTQVALDVLKSGGNAVDAAIAANAAQGLMEPVGNGIGGDLFAIVWDAESQALYGLNASGRSPGDLSLQWFLDQGYESIPSYGPLPVSVPGCVDGWFELHQRFGSMPMSDGAADIYALSCLTWPKPDGCMRDPISIKLCDITLFDEAATYDMDAVRFAPAQADEAAL